MKSIFKYLDKKRQRERAQGLRFLGGFMCVVAVGIVFLSCVTALRSFWPKTMAVVTDSEIEKKVETKYVSKSGRLSSNSDTKEKRIETDYRLKVGYKYSVNNKEYEGRGLAFHDDEEAEVISKQNDDYPVGRKIQIAYNPSDPTDTDLRPATMLMSFMFLLTAGGVGFGGFMLLKTKTPTDLPTEDY